MSTPQPKKSSNPDSSPPTKRKRGDGDASTDSDKSNVVDITVPSEPSCSSKGLETQQKTAKKDERGFSPHWFFNMKTGEKRTSKHGTGKKGETILREFNEHVGAKYTLISLLYSFVSMKRTAPKQKHEKNKNQAAF